MMELEHKHSVWQVWSNSFHSNTYTFGIYTDQKLAEEVCEQLIKEGIFSLSASAPQHGIKEIKVYGKKEEQT